VREDLMRRVDPLCLALPATHWTRGTGHCFW